MRHDWLLWGLGIGVGLSTIRWLLGPSASSGVRRGAPLRYPTSAERDALYGPLLWEPAPTADNPEAIRITNGFERQIVAVEVPSLGRARIHRGAAPSLVRALEEIERLGWSDKLRSFEGGFEPRVVRRLDGTPSGNLSSHAYGTAIDVNAGRNPQGGEATADQRDLAGVFERHGWYWGARFSTPDPMHFEFVLPPERSLGTANV